MRKRTIASMFSGGGGWEVGAKQAGFTPLWGIEYIPEIAAVYERNIGHAPIVMDATKIQSSDIARLPQPEVFVASPPCQAHSAARQRPGLVPRLDIDSGKAVAKVLTELRPPVVIIENVVGYRTHPTLQMLIDLAAVLGYTVEKPRIVDMEQYGCPSSRRRMICRMALGPLPPWPAKRPSAGWLAAVEDLLPTFPLDELAPWQIARLDRLDERHQPREYPILVSSNNVSSTAFGEGKIVRVSRSRNQPAWTLVATHGAMSQTRVVFNRNRLIVTQATPRAFARWAGFPDSYWLPPQAALATKVVGNAVPPAFSKVLFEAMR